MSILGKIGRSWECGDYRPYTPLANRKLGIWPSVGSMKCQNNICFGHSDFYQFIRHSDFCAIALNPNFTIFDFDVDETAEYPCSSVMARVTFEGIAMYYDCESDT